MSVGDQTPSNLPPGIWQDLLCHAYALIDEITKHGISDPVWTFGGGLDADSVVKESLTGAAWSTLPATPEKSSVVQKEPS